MDIVREGFFAFLEDIAPPEAGFSLFGGTHLAALGLTILLAIAMCYLCKRLSDDRRWLLFRLWVVMILLMEIIQQFTFPFIHGNYWLCHIPLHMCGLLMFIEAAHVTRPNKFTGEVLYALGLPGAVAAMLFPNWTMAPITNFYALQSFVIHAFHIVFVIMLLFTGNIRPSFRGLWRPALFLLIVLPPIYLFNTITGTNFFFLNAGSAGSPLEALIDIFGNPGFLIPYAGILGFVWVLMYLPWGIRAKMIDTETKLFRH